MGVLGYRVVSGRSRRRHAELLARLSEWAPSRPPTRPVPRHHLNRPLDFNAGARNLFAPAGLDIGSEAPEEIALSITSEIAAVLSDRRGGFLRERKSDIHRTTATGAEAA